MPTDSEWLLSRVWRPRHAGEPPTRVLEHTGYPYDAIWASDDTGDLIAIAGQYLFKAQGAFELGALIDAGGTFNVPLAWLPLPARPLAPAPPDLLPASLWSARFDLSGPSPVVLDHAAVLLAVQTITPNDAQTAIGSRLGIRVIAHVELRATPPRGVHIVGVAASPELDELTATYHADVTKMFKLFFGPDRGGFRFDLLTMVRRAGGLDSATLTIDGLRVRKATGLRPLVDLYLNAARPTDQPYAPALAVTARLSVGTNGVPLVEAVEQTSHSAHAVYANQFRRDPASTAGPGAIIDARPNRAPDRLTNYWQGATVPGLPGTSASLTSLIDDLGQVNVLESRLTDSRLSDPLAPETNTIQIVPLCIPDPRTHWFAALSGYRHARDLFDTMRSYNLAPETFFRFAVFPLRIRYRAPIDPGPGRDGRTINAQVDYDPPEGDLLGGTTLNTAALKPLQVRFAVADLKRTWAYRRAPYALPLREQPLGLATDERWSWHEYCHVLLAASTGALELPFSHSAGDALAAIMGDPDSALSPNEHLRGMTFPWVYLHRRHDRSVFEGWSWSGRRHRQARFGINSNRRHKGYESEQIMSTSLFRAYQALGGDTTSDLVVRQRAADYIVYLVMRAIDLLGPSWLMPADTPANFVQALVAADTATLPVSSGPLADRVGGWAGKVVQWAFEAQGLDIRRDPLKEFDTPGEPPDVDVYIDNNRPPSQGTHPRGGYMPVPLDWATDPAPWHASATGINIMGSTATVQVQNRGSLPADAVTVTMWTISWPMAPVNPPKWDPATWTKLTTPAAQDIPAGGTKPFTFSGLPTTAGKYLVLAEATCVADQSNIDTTTSRPTNSHPTPIVDLVAGDNNLGLRLLIV